MPKVPVPAQLCFQVSQDAVRFAREQMGGWGWSEKSMQALQPRPGDGMVGITTTEKYLMHQERGIKPFLMWWVNGRTIGMNCAQGDGPHFRRGGHVGEPGYVDIPHQGKVWRDQRWRHPGFEGKNFMQNGLQQAIQQNQPMIKQWLQGLVEKKQ